jgi:putative spermidine/putrescine transport system substrate-binding protein
VPIPSLVPSLAPTRRTLLAAGAALAGIGRSAAAATTITVAGPDWAQQGFASAVVAPFRRANPGLDVFYYPAATALQIFSLVQTERFGPSIDIALIDSVTSQAATARGLLQPITAADFPVMGELLPDAQIPRSVAPVMAWDTLAIGYSRDLVAAPPKSWHDLWDGGASQIALPTPPSLIALAFNQAAACAFGGKGDLQSLNIGLNAIGALAPRVSKWDPRPDVYTAVAFGDAAIGPGWNGPARTKAAAMPSRYGVVLPEDGSPPLPIVLALVKNAPKANAAAKLVAWILGRPAQEAMTESLFLAPANATATPSAAALALAGATPKAIARRMPIDWWAMTAIKEQLVDAWQQRNLGAR